MNKKNSERTEMFLRIFSIVATFFLTTLVIVEHANILFGVIIALTWLLVNLKIWDYKMKKIHVGYNTPTEKFTSVIEFFKNGSSICNKECSCKYCQKMKRVKRLARRPALLPRKGLWVLKLEKMFPNPVVGLL